MTRLLLIALAAAAIALLLRSRPVANSGQWIGEPFAEPWGDV
jgi:hypothetical protein